MSIEEKYPLLIWHSSQGNQELHSIQDGGGFHLPPGAGKRSVDHPGGWLLFSEYLRHLY